MQAFIDECERKLAQHQQSLVDDFRAAREQLAPRMAEAELRAWASEGVQLAEHSLRSWEAASEYFKLSPAALAALPPQAFRRWAHAGRDLAECSSLIAIAYFRASPRAVAFLAEPQITEWAALGQRLYRGNWKSISLATMYFAAGPALLSLLTLERLARLVALVEQVAERSYEVATDCLDSAPHLFETLEPADRGPFLRLAAAIADASWADVRPLFQRGAALLEPLDPAERTRLLTLGTRVAGHVGRHAYGLFAEAAASIERAPPAARSDLLGLAEELAVGSPPAAMEFLKSAPSVLERVRLRDLRQWHAAGHRILESSPEGGEAYFRLESGKGEEVLQDLSSRVELGQVGEVLRLYCQALTGTNVSIHPATQLAEKGIGWVSEERPSTEGTTVYLPEYVDEHVEKTQNFAVYKVYSTHQAAHLEFGSFWFRFGRKGGVLKRRRHLIERERREAAREAGEKPARGKRKPLTDMERFFDIFDERQLALDLFTIAEDVRIDAFVRREYGGIRRSWGRTQEMELERRPDVRSLPLRQAFLENLVRASLDGARTIVWPQGLASFMADALRLLEQMRDPRAAVEDAAECTLALYELASRLPNILPEELEDVQWEEMTEESLEVMLGSPSGGESDLTMPSGEEVSYQSPRPVDFRGDFKPELVQLLMRLRLKEGKQAAGDLSPLTADQLRELLEKSVEINVSAMAEGDLASTIGLFLTNLEKEAGTPIPEQKLEIQDGTPLAEAAGDGEGELPQEEEKLAFYDEWDFRAADYKPRWCCVRERTLEEGTPDFYEETLREHAPLVAETRRQFELLRPELFRKIRRLHDGEDFDLDLVVDYFIEKKSGHSYTDKVYWRRNKVERDVAVAFLLDMSASTDEEIEKRKQKYHEEPDFDDDPRRYFQWLAQRRAQQAIAPPKRIIDLEKESLVLLIRALETIGDSYGIYGFSGYGRDNVEFYVIKGLEETFSDHVVQRLDKVAPIRSTRMGPAIRHATAKLDTHDAKVKILFLVSDGRPQDHGYGRDRTEKEYAIHDTKQALMEARRQGITPFALTVDKEGHDYLGQMCEDMGYEVLADIEALPGRLPTLYRRLTE
jgi:nitric oxide reductase activation protein